LRTGGSAAPAIRILIADDHPIFCAGLRRLLEVEPGFEVIAEARDGVEALELAIALNPDLVLLDFAMPRMAGVDVVRELTSRATRSRLMLLTAAIGRQQIVEALRLGAHGVVLKEAASELLFRAIRAVMGGQTWIGRETVTDLVHYMRGQRPESEQRKFRLTPREQQVVAAVVSGLTNKDIARQFSVSEDTIKHHVSNIFDKLGVSNRLELALVALDYELVDRRQPLGT
jgi:two-component system, NarL family, nitrate/nitrite response regulator NarL